MGKGYPLSVGLKDNKMVYFPGQTVEGEVIAHFQKEEKIREIRIRLHGYAYVYWEEVQTKRSRNLFTGDVRTSTTTKHYTSEETYCDNIQRILTPGTGVDHVAVKPGEYRYPFSFILPERCATSFEGSVGQVRYYLNVIVDGKKNYDDKTKLPITVIKILDLNKMGGTACEAMTDKDKMICCLCCKSGPISGKITLERTGYVPGEGIPIKAECINNSRRDIFCTKVTLQMIITYHTAKESTSETKILAEMERGPIPAGDSDTWFGEQLAIPALPSSGLPGCSIIDIEYKIWFIAKPRGPSFNLYIPIDIIVGNVPLMSQWHKYGVIANDDTIRDETTSDTRFAHSSEQSLRVSSYSECALGPMRGGYKPGDTSKKSTTPTNDENKFTPMYTIYNVTAFSDKTVSSDGDDR